MCSLEGKKYFRKKHISFFFYLNSKIPPLLIFEFSRYRFTKKPEKKVHLRQKSRFFLFFDSLNFRKRRRGRERVQRENVCRVALARFDLKIIPSLKQIFP